MSTTALIPSRNEKFLKQTIEDLLRNARGEFDIIAFLDGGGEEPVKDPRVSYVQNVPAIGQRASLNKGASVAKGEHIMKIDAHTAWGEGFDLILAGDCEHNWISIPRRYSLDAENWCRKDKHWIDYQYIQCPLEGDNALSGVVWDEKNYDKELEKVLIDDLATFQGSTWFMHKDYFHELELLDEEHYGSFRKDPQEMSFKAWCSGGRVVVNKKTWYAHLHKGKQYGRGYTLAKEDWDKGDEFIKEWLTDSAWNEKQTKPFRQMIDYFKMPGWEKYQWPNSTKAFL